MGWRESLGQLICETQHVNRAGHDLLGHLSVGGELAARNRDEPILTHDDLVLPAHRRLRDLCVRRLRGNERTDPSPGRNDVVSPDWIIREARLERQE